MGDGLKYFATATIAILAVSSWEWGLPVALVIGLVAFWHPLVKLCNQVGMDRQAKRLAKAGPHGEVNGNARVAHEARVYRKK